MNSFEQKERTKPREAEKIDGVTNQRKNLLESSELDIRALIEVKVQSGDVILHMNNCVLPFVIRNPHFRRKQRKSGRLGIFNLHQMSKRAGMSDALVGNYEVRSIIARPVVSIFLEYYCVLTSALENLFGALGKSSTARARSQCAIGRADFVEVVCGTSLEGLKYTQMSRRNRGEGEK